MHQNLSAESSSSSLPVAPAGSSSFWAWQDAQVRELVPCARYFKFVARQFIDRARNVANCEPEVIAEHFPEGSGLLIEVEGLEFQIKRVLLVLDEVKDRLIEVGVSHGDSSPLVGGGPGGSGSPSMPTVVGNGAPTSPGAPGFSSTASGIGNVQVPLGRRSWLAKGGGGPDAVDRSGGL